MVDDDNDYAGFYNTCAALAADTSNLLERVGTATKGPQADWLNELKRMYQLAQSMVDCMYTQHEHSDFTTPKALREGCIYALGVMARYEQRSLLSSMNVFAGTPINTEDKIMEAGEALYLKLYDARVMLDASM